MTIRDQLDTLVRLGVEFVVVGGQAGVLRQAVEFSHDLDVLVLGTDANAERIVRAIREITDISTNIETILGRDFQQYINPVTGEELDIHLKLLALPDYAAGLKNSSRIDYLGIQVACLELPALYASKRTDRPRDALHRQAIEDRLRTLVLSDAIQSDEVVLACCLDGAVAKHTGRDLALAAASTEQPLLQARVLAIDEGLVSAENLMKNPHLHPTVRSVLSLDVMSRDKLLRHRSRLAALLTRLPLVLPLEGYRIRWR
jgi:hypothetical protein